MRDVVNERDDQQSTASSESKLKQLKKVRMVKEEEDI